MLVDDDDEPVPEPAVHEGFGYGSSVVKLANDAVKEAARLKKRRKEERALKRRVRSGESLSQWAHRALLPNLAARGYNASSTYDGGGRLDDPPLYVESLPAMMAFAANAARGVLPCPECSAAAGDVSFCSAYSHAEGGN